MYFVCGNSDGAVSSGGTFWTEPFALPVCGADEALSLHLNIFAAIGRGVFVEMRFASGKELISRSTVIQGGSVDHIVIRSPHFITMSVCCGFHAF